MSRHWKQMYHEVRQTAPDIYNEVIAAATAIGHNHKLGSPTVSDIEFRMMRLVHHALKLDILNPVRKA